MCDALGYTRQAYYKQIRNRSEWLEKRQQIVDSVNSIRKELPKTGTVKIHAHFRQQWAAQGIKIGRDKTFDVLRESGLLQRKRKRSKPQTTWSAHWRKKHPDLAKNTIVTRANELWVSDITYLPINASWCYLFLITDAYSHKIVGYHVSYRLDTSAALQALQMALSERKDTAELIHHSDRGIQYCSHSYVRLLKKNRIRVSMTQSGSPYDNAIAERINGIVKHELIYPFGELTSLEQAKTRVKEAVTKYNNLRLHQSLQYKTPESVHMKCKPLSVIT